VSGYDDYFKPLVLLASMTPGVSLDDVVDDLLSVSFENEMGALDKLTLVLRNPEHKYKNDRRFRFGIRFMFRFGYRGRLTARRVMVTRGVVPTYGTAGTIELVAFDSGVDLSARTGPRNWGPLSSSDIARKVAVMFGLRADVDDSEDGRKADRIQPAAVSFYEYLNTLADQIGFEFSVEDGVLIFKKMDMGEPVGKYTYFGTPFTLLKGFRPDIDAAKPPATRHANTAASGRKAESSQTGASASDKRSAQNQGRFRINLSDLSTLLVPADATGEATREVTRPTAETAANARRVQVRAEQTKIEMAASSAAAELIGDPYVMARRVIDIQGVDYEYVGPWKVVKAVHSISDTYTTSVQLRRLGKPRGASGSKVPGHQRASESGHKAEAGGENDRRETSRNLQINTANLSTRLVNQRVSGGTGGGVG
jgi:phage protein D